MNDEPEFVWRITDDPLTAAAGFQNTNITVDQGWLGPIDRSNVQVLERPPEFKSIEDADRWLEEHG